MHRPIAMRVFCAYKTVYPTLWIWNIIYMILLIKCLLLITTAHQRCLTSLAVSDKRIPEWFSVICRPQNWGLVCWEAMPGVKSGVLCVVAVQCSCSCCTVHFHPSLAAWKPRQCTSAWRHRLKLTQGVRDMFIRAWGMSMSWSSISLKRGQQPAELHWSSDWSVARSFSSVSQSQEQILNICFSIKPRSHTARCRALPLKPCRAATRVAARQRALPRGNARQRASNYMQMICRYMSTKWRRL